MVKKIPDNTNFNLKEAEVLSIPTKTVLLEEGKIANKIYLIRKGCLRLFFYNEGKDITFQFFFEGDFVASFDSLYKGTPSMFSLESIEPSEVLSIKKEDFYNKIESNPSLRQLYEEKIIERFSFYQHLLPTKNCKTRFQNGTPILKNCRARYSRCRNSMIRRYTISEKCTDRNLT